MESQRHVLIAYLNTFCGIYRATLCSKWIYAHTHAQMFYAKFQICENTTVKVSLCSQFICIISILLSKTLNTHTNTQNIFIYLHTDMHTDEYSVISALVEILFVQAKYNLNDCAPV